MCGCVSTHKQAILISRKCKHFISIIIVTFIKWCWKFASMHRFLSPCYSQGSRFGLLKTAPKEVSINSMHVLTFWNYTICCHFNSISREKIEKSIQRSNWRSCRRWCWDVNKISWQYFISFVQLYIYICLAGAAIALIKQNYMKLNVSVNEWAKKRARTHKRAREFNVSSQMKMDDSELWCAETHSVCRYVHIHINLTWPTLWR